MQKTIQKERALDGMKGIAACIVAFVWHYQHFGVMGADSPLYTFLKASYDYGWLMVELFFMLSGFGMMMGYKDRITEGKLSFPAFFFRRLGKLYPLHLATLLIVTVLEGVYLSKTGTTFVYPNFDLYHFALNVLCMQNGFFGTEWSFNSPSWCLSIFLILYTLFYCIIRKGKKDTVIVISFGVTFLLGGLILFAGWNLPVANELTARGLLCFSVGVILYYIYRNRERLPWKLIGVMSFLLCIGIYVFVRLRGWEAVGNVRMQFILSTGPLLILSLLFFKPLNLVVGSKPFAWLGSISMDIYLLHFPVQCAIRVMDLHFNWQLDYASISVWLVYGIAVLLVATINRKCISPLFRWLKTQIKTGGMNREQQKKPDKAL